MLQDILLSLLQKYREFNSPYQCMARTSFYDMGYSVHTWRRTFATWLYNKGVDLLQIQRLLGHSRPETTALYVQTPSDDLFEAVSMLDDYNVIPPREPSLHREFYG
jgi:integrase